MATPKLATGAYDPTAQPPNPELLAMRDRTMLEASAATLALDGTAARFEVLATLQQKLWNQHALHLLDCGFFDDAAKASREAVRHGTLAISWAKATLADRVAVLELEVLAKRERGAAIRAESERRRQTRNDD